jgi:hypothetical protein
MAPSITPLSKVKRPSTTSDSAKVQPPMVGRALNATHSGMAVNESHRSEVNPSLKKSARYWSESRAERRSWAPSRRR